MRILLLLLLSVSVSSAQTVSYWFQGWQRKPDAAQAQAYFMLPGTNVTFTYTNNRVVINAGTNGGGGTNFYYTNTFTTNFYYTNTFTTNAYYTNTFTTNFYYTNIVDQTNIYATNLIGFLEGTNILFSTNGSGFLSVNCTIDTNSIVSTQTNIFATNLIGFLEGTNIIFTTNASGYLAVNNGIDTNNFATWNVTNLFGVPCVIFVSGAFPTNQAGCGAIGYGPENLAVGAGADARSAGSNRGTSIGVNSIGYDQGAAIGCAAQGQTSGAAVGYAAFGYTAGAAIGQGARGETYGAAVGFNARADGAGVAIGYATDGHTDGVAIGDYAFGWGVGNVAIAGTDDVNNIAKIPVGYTDTVELGRGTGTLSGALHFRGFPFFTKEFVLVSTNLYFTVPKWIDIPMNYSFSVAGANTPTLTPVTNLSVIKGLGFKNTSELFAQAQFPHSLAITNAAFPSFYFEPHVHFDTIGTLDSTHSNVTWQIEWQIANINGTWQGGTNTVTIGVTNNYTHYLAEFGHITNNTPMTISAVFRCRLMRPASASQEYSPNSSSADVLMDAFDLHVPIANTNAIGSSTDSAP